MKQSEAHDWIDAMHEAAILAQMTTIRGYKQRVAPDRDLTELDGEIIRSISGRLFDGPPDADNLGLGPGIVLALEVILRRIKEGGSVRVQEFYNLMWVFDGDPALGISLLSVMPNTRSTRQPLTIDGKKATDIPPLDLEWMSKHLEEWK